MQFERDILHEKVLPALNAEAVSYGEFLSLCDLRWGVNTRNLSEEERTDKVLSVCFEEIDRCHPYMIVLLGTRYGWIPDTGGDSVTEMEIQYGALSRTWEKNNLQCLFYFRNADYDTFPEEYQKEDEDHVRRLNNLKARIRDFAAPDRVKEYTLSWNSKAGSPEGLDAFAEMVRKDILGLMHNEWKERLSLSVWEKETLLQWNLDEERVQQFAARQTLLNRLTEELAASEKENGLVIVRGGSGLGKSMLLSRLAKDLKLAGEEVFPVFCGSSVLSCTADSVVRCMIRYLEKLNGNLAEASMDDTALNAMSDNELQELLAELVRQYEEKKEKPLTFVIDAIDQLTPSEMRDHFRFVPSNLGKKVRIVLSVLDDFPLPTGMQTRILQMRPLETEERAQIVRGILAFQSKELDDEIIDRLTKKKNAGNPLYLSILLQRLLMMDRHDFEWIRQHGGGNKATTVFEMQLIDGMSDDLQTAAIDVFRHALKKSDNLAIKEAASYISMSRYGLRPEDLMSIVEDFSLLDFTVFTGYLRPFFLVREDGRYDFSHRVIKEGMFSLWANPETLHEKITLSLLNLDPRDSIRRSELIWHSFGARREDLFFDCMQQTDPDARAQSAMTLKDCCMRDQEDWIGNRILNLKNETTENALPALNFLLDDFTQALSGTEDDLAIGQRVLQNVLTVIREKQNKLFNDSCTAETAMLLDDAFFECCRLLGKLSLARGSAYAPHAVHYLESALGNYTPEKVEKLLQKGMKREHILRILHTTSMLRSAYAAAGEPEKGLQDSLKYDLVLQRSLTGKLCYEEDRYTRMTMAQALKTQVPRISSIIEASIATEDSSKRLRAYNMLKLLINNISKTTAGYQSLREEMISLKEIMARLLAESGEPVLIFDAGTLYDEIIAYREEKMREDESGTNMAALSKALIGAGEAAALAGQADLAEQKESRKKAVSLMTRGIRMAQQRSVLLGTEESLLSLADAYRHLQKLYEKYASQDSSREALSIAAEIALNIFRLFHAAALRWPSKELRRMEMDAGLTAEDLLLASSSKEQMKKASELMKSIAEIGHGHNNDPVFVIDCLVAAAKVQQAFGGEGNLKRASSNAEKAFYYLSKLLGWNGTEINITENTAGMNTEAIEAARWKYTPADLAGIACRQGDIFLAQNVKDPKKALEKYDEALRLYALLDIPANEENGNDSGAKSKTGSSRAEAECQKKAAQAAIHLGKEKEEYVVKCCLRGEKIMETIVSQDSSPADWELYRDLLILHSESLRGAKLEKVWTEKSPEMVLCDAGDESQDTHNKRENARLLAGTLRTAAEQAFILNPSTSNMRSFVICMEKEALDILCLPKFSRDEALQCLRDVKIYTASSAGKEKKLEAALLNARLAKDIAVLQLQIGRLADWENGVRLLQDSTNVTLSAARKANSLKSWGYCKNNAVNIINLLQRIAQEEKSSGEKSAVCQNGAANIYNNYITACRYLNAGDEDPETYVDAEITESLIRKNTLFRLAEKNIPGIYTSNIRDTGLAAAQAAEALMQKEATGDAGRQARKLYLRAALGCGAGISILDGANSEILEVLLKAESIALDLLKEGDRSVRTSLSEICADIAHDYILANPVRNALRIREYKKKAKQYAD